MLFLGTAMLFRVETKGCFSEQKVKCKNRNEKIRLSNRESKQPNRYGGLLIHETFGYDLINLIVTGEKWGNRK